MISARLNEIRKANDMSQKELASKLSLTRFTISSYENEKSEPSLETIISICKLYDVSADYLLGLIDNPTPINRKNGLLEILYRLPIDIQDDIIDCIEYKVIKYKKARRDLIEK